MGSIDFASGTDSVSGGDVGQTAPLGTMGGSGDIETPSNNKGEVSTAQEKSGPMPRSGNDIMFPCEK